jgi:hypothetical protein
LATKRADKSVVILILILGVNLLELTGLDFVKNDLVSSLEGVLETVGKGVVALGADGLILAASLGHLLLEGSLAGSLASNVGLGLESGGSLGVGVEALHEGLVLEGVLVVGASNGLVVADFAELGLDLVGVDNAGEVSDGHAGAVKLVAGLLDALLTVGTEDLVELGEGVLSVDHEATEVTSGSELEEVKAVHGAGVDTGKVASSALEEGVLVTVDNKGALGLGEARVAHLAKTGAHLLGAGVGEAGTSTDGGEGLEESVGGLDVEAVNNEGELGDGVALVSAGEHEGSASRGSQSRGDGVTLLVGVDLAVPLSPGADGSEHASLTAHVTEGGLSSAVGTGSTNTGNTGNSATGTPGFSGVLHTLVTADTVGLASVLVHVGMDKGDGVVTDGGGEDGGHLNLAGNGLFFGVNTHNGSGGHL